MKRRDLMKLGLRGAVGAVAARNVAAEPLPNASSVIAAQNDLMPTAREIIGFERETPPAVRIAVGNSAPLNTSIEKSAMSLSDIDVSAATAEVSPAIVSDNIGDGGLYFSGDIPQPSGRWLYEPDIVAFLNPTQNENVVNVGTGASHFFDRREMRTLREVTERIIPTDDHSPGAQTAGVSEFIDLFVNVSQEKDKTTWKDGIKAINAMSGRMFGRDFFEASVDQQVALLTEISKNEQFPITVEEKFFNTVKRMTWDVYYRSEVGIQMDLRYQGNTHLDEFTGCTHPEHLL
jgi:hypothetical protein